MVSDDDNGGVEYRTGGDTVVAVGGVSTVTKKMERAAAAAEFGVRRQ